MAIWRFVSVLVILSFVWTPSLARAAAGAEVPGAQAGAAWTFMVYMAGDNDLETFALADYHEMEQVGSTAQVNVVVQIDRAEGYDDTEGDWTDARRSYIQAQQGGANSPTESLGEVNMGSQDTLAEFLIWAVTSYPAERYALVLWDHGSGWPGIAYDDSAEGDGLTVPEIVGALGQMRESAGVDVLDVIAFDACLMGQIEVYLAMAPYAQVSVASPELIPGYGYDYVSTLEALTADPNMDGAQLGNTIVDTYMYYYENVDTGNPAFGLTAVDLSRSAAVYTAMGDLVQAVQANPSAALSQIGDARNNALTYTRHYLPTQEVEETAAVDLGDLMRRLADATYNVDVAQAAQAVVDAVAGMVLRTGHSDNLVNATGVAVYFPRTAGQFEAQSADYQAQAGQEVRWLDFLNVYHATASEVIVDAPQLFITGLFEDAVSIHQPTQVSMDLTGRDIAQVEFVVNHALEPGRYVTLDRDMLVSWEEVDETLVAVNEWEDGLNSILFPWNGETPIVTDGETQTYALLVPSGASFDVAVGQGRYAPAGSEKWVQATLVFDIDSQQVTAVYGVSNSPGSPPFEIKPSPGDQFQFEWVIVNDDGSTSTLPGDTLVFSDTPFRYEYVPAPSGAYRMGFIASNIAGDTAYRYVDLMVDNEGLDASLRGYTDWDFGFNFLYPATWEDPSWNAENEVLYANALTGDVSFTIYPLADIRDLREAAAAVQGQWDVQVSVLNKRAATVSGAEALVVYYEYEGTEGPRQGVYATLYHPAVDMSFGFDLDAAAEDAEGAFAEFEAMLSSLRLFAPAAIGSADAWTVDVNQALGYALPVPTEWLPAALNEGGWMVYGPPSGNGQTFAAVRADISKGLPNDAMAEEWLSALTALDDHLNVQVTGRREYYIGNQRWYAIGFTYVWEATGTPTKGAFFVTNYGEVSYVLWVEAPEADYSMAYGDTFTVMIDGFELLAGARPTMALPAGDGLLRQVYTASGDSLRPEKLTPTATFAVDDDINVVFVASADAQVGVVFIQPDGASIEVEAIEVEAGVSDLTGLDWETNREPWMTGQWSAEVYVNGEEVQTLTFTVEAQGAEGASAPVVVGPLSGAYTAAGDGMEPETLTPTAQFGPDDDINIVLTMAADAEVRVVFLLPDDLSGELGPAVLEGGSSHVLGLDWESYGEPWPAGEGTAEVYADGQLLTTLAFEIGG